MKKNRKGKIMSSLSRLRAKKSRVIRIGYKKGSRGRGGSWLRWGIWPKENKSLIVLSPKKRYLREKEVLTTKKWKRKQSEVRRSRT